MLPIGVVVGKKVSTRLLPSNQALLLVASFSFPSLPMDLAAFGSPSLLGAPLEIYPSNLSVLFRFRHPWICCIRHLAPLRASILVGHSVSFSGVFLIARETDLLWPWYAHLHAMESSGDFVMACRDFV
jgi:hypothetical protein